VFQLEAYDGKAWRRRAPASPCKTEEKPKIKPTGKLVGCTDPRGISLVLFIK